MLLNKIMLKTIKRVHIYYYTKERNNTWLIKKKKLNRV